MKNAKPLARALLDLAEEVEAAERRIKEEIIDAARRNDVARILEISDRWLRMPPTEVLKNKRTVSKG